jgi:NAD-dependent SIR2 family protein deacetylase
MDVATISRVNPALGRFYKRTRPFDIVIGNSAVSTGETTRWTCFVRPSGGAIKSVRFELHPTFSERVVVVDTAPFQITRVGWGVFTVGIVVEDLNGGIHRYEHLLAFDGATPSERCETLAPVAGGAEASPITPRVMTGVSEALMHGADGVGKGFAAPRLVVFCAEDARPGYASMAAHEYREEANTLRSKVKLLAALVKRSSRMAAYTGAGISTGAGIADYASKSKRSVATGTAAEKSGMRAKQARGGGLNAAPTFAHFTLVELHRAGHLKRWVQQNHDGLPQKAGLPQECINEIHGAWFDPSNPVVPMSGHLRGDLCEELEATIESADLVLAMGTSLCGMNADRMVEGPARRRLERGEGLGAVIVGFQRTSMDEVASLRIFERIDKVMLLLAVELGLPTPGRVVRPVPIARSNTTAQRHVYMVPYDADGKRLVGAAAADPAQWLRWSLKRGSALKLTAGPGDGFVGTVDRVPSRGECAYLTCFPNTREGSASFGKVASQYALGEWWVSAACRGAIPLLPVVNA